MAITITRADFDDARLAGFLQAHLDDIEPTAPRESRHALDFSGLRGPRVRLWVASDDAHLVGTVALARLEPRHEELKSMRTAPAQRGQGAASRLLDVAMADARSRGVTQVSLETGSMDFFRAARAFYRKHGFRDCAPFGPYEADPNSVFLTRRLER